MNVFSTIVDYFDNGRGVTEERLCLLPKPPVVNNRRVSSNIFAFDLSSIFFCVCSSLSKQFCKLEIFPTNKFSIFQNEIELGATKHKVIKTIADKDLLQKSGSLSS